MCISHALHFLKKSECRVVQGVVQSREWWLAESTTMLYNARETGIIIQIVHFLENVFFDRVELKCVKSALEGRDYEGTLI